MEVSAEETEERPGAKVAEKSAPSLSLGRVQRYPESQQAVGCPIHSILLYKILAAKT